MSDYIPIYVSNNLSGGSWTQKEQYWKIGQKKIWGRSMWIDFYDWAKTKQNKKHADIGVQNECPSQGDLIREEHQ